MPIPSKGFIALTSALVISAVIITIALGGSLAGFYLRAGSMQFEAKERSRQLARSCVSQTLLALAHDRTFAGNASSTVYGTELTCYTSGITKEGTPPNETYHFRTRGYVQDTYTVLSVTADARDVSVISAFEAMSF